MNTSSSSDTLRSKLTHEPRELKFGTSGRRGEVVHLTQLEVYLNALAELEYLLSLPLCEGGISLGDEFFYGFDLRPSSSRYVAEQQNRGEIAQAIEKAIGNAGMKPVNLGQIPTPALAFYALSKVKGSIMVTGSHIPFDRNGYKTNTSRGELLKKHELPINEKVLEVRQRLYAQPFSESLFDGNGRFKSGHHELMQVDTAGANNYVRRYTGFFDGISLAGFRLVVYQHSAVGRDIVVELLRQLGAEVIPAGRSETFIPIDTENMDGEQLATIQSLHDQVAASHGQIDAVISTDGDTDRPMILGVDNGEVHFFAGDRVGMVTAEFLGADAVVVPISCNDAIDLGQLKDIIAPKTKIGSPFVIAGMEKAIAKGKRAVCGFEANGGFLTGSDFTRNGKTLASLPTRDAMLPILAVLFAAKEKGLTLSQLFEFLPKRYGSAALLKAFPRTISQTIINRFSPSDSRISEIVIETSGMVLLDENGLKLAGLEAEIHAIESFIQELKELFTAVLDFGDIVRINYLDGVRIYFNNGDVAHIRPSGNADELRIYAVANTQDRANTIVQLAVQEPDGIFRCLENNR
ncbi:MAG: phosphomannomutase [Candidatus Methylumidiphilus alinenensis]|uniref:Phosphomannomutase n=1 Tax=Candidatus Methylumidiphilus alinenensis TaxID=2202197 RepID=A0A2W4RAC6_9GAMM|nr:MAG: phosphomannomutase [Candidatus Methylumidiphilus alinenensis]